MRPFDRITAHSTPYGTQARIRNLPITVAQVVRDILAGDAAEAVCQRYPGLQSDDITQALAYAVHDLTRRVIVWQHEGALPAHSLRGSVELLEAPTTPEQQALVSELRQLALQSQTAWQQVGLLAELLYTPDFAGWRAVPLSHILAAAQHRLTQSGTPARLTVQAADTLPAVRTFGHLPTALCNLATEHWDGLLTEQADLSIQVHEDRVCLEMARYYGPFTVEPAAQPELITWTGGPIAIAALILERHDSYLHVRTTADGLLLHCELTAVT